MRYLRYRRNSGTLLLWRVTHPNSYSFHIYILALVLAAEFQVLDHRD